MAKNAGGKRKVNRNRKWCEAYRAAGKREKSKAKRLARHLASLPKGSFDATADASWKALPEWAKSEALKKRAA